MSSDFSADDPRSDHTETDGEAFEVFVRRAVPMTSRPFVTIQKRGMLSISSAAHVLLGRPDAVELMYDARHQVIGIRAVEPTAEHAYPLRAPAGKPDGPFVVSATAFLKYFDILPDSSRRRVAEFGHGVLRVDLREEGTSVTSNRAAAPTRPPADDLGVRRAAGRDRRARQDRQDRRDRHEEDESPGSG